MTRRPPRSTLFPYTRSSDLFRRNLERSETEGDLWDLVTAYNNVGVVEYGRGNFHAAAELLDRKSTRLNSSHGYISYAVFCLKKKKKKKNKQNTNHIK